MESTLPDEIWSEILFQSTKLEGGLGAEDLCTLALVSKQWRRVSTEDRVWLSLLNRDFESDSETASKADADPKTAYKSKFEKRKAKREGLRRRQVLRLESSLHSSMLEVANYEKKLEEERTSIRNIRQRLDVLLRSRASVALHIWQPQAVRTHHQRVVQQVPVDPDAEISGLRLALQEHYSYMETYVKALGALEKSIELNMEELKRFHWFNSIGSTGGKSVSKSKSRKKFYGEWLSRRKSKKAKIEEGSQCSSPSSSQPTQQLIQ